MRFPFYKQLNAMDCGVACLRMISHYYGKRYDAISLRRLAGYGKQGVSLLGVSEAAEKLGFRIEGAKLTYEKLIQASLPCILHWNQNHFVVLYALKGKIDDQEIMIADPAKGIISYNKEEFIQSWGTSSSGGKTTGIALLLQPTQLFHTIEGGNEKRDIKSTRSLIFKYIIKSRGKFAEVFIIMIFTSLLQLAFPFLTKNVVDIGISQRNLNYITIVLVAQLSLTFSRTIADFIRSRLLLKVSNFILFSTLSDFWSKLTRIHLSYFNIHQVGDTIERLADHKQIQSFLTGSAISTLFSIFNLFLYSFILVWYSVQIFFIYCIGSLLFLLWIRLFLPTRRKLNYQLFDLSAKENDTTFQFIEGMPEIRLNNAEKLKRREWENVQKSIFGINFKNLTYNQYQQIGGLFINQSKDIIIVFLVAQMVVEGHLTLGTMLAVQYIIGQLNGPIDQIVGFLQTAQNAKISMERIDEIHRLEDEEASNVNYMKIFPGDTTIYIRNLYFSYPGADDNLVLDNITLSIPEGKVTAIVGLSGSGKTTLLKLLLKFYDFFSGDINIGEEKFKEISPSFWRSQCGAVLQDGFVFNDTIARNISLGDEKIDHERLVESCKISNILSFVESLPNKFETQLGTRGIGISEGQKQRILIARAIYKNPKYLFFDEATNALDANNERFVIEQMQSVFRNRTVVTVAHRLSTVKNAHKIVVIHEGKVAEEGSHEYLVGLKGHYYRLIENQLELGG